MFGNSMQELFIEIGVLIVLIGVCLWYENYARNKKDRNKIDRARKRLIEILVSIENNSSRVTYTEMKSIISLLGKELDISLDDFNFRTPKKQRKEDEGKETKYLLSYNCSRYKRYLIREKLGIKSFKAERFTRGKKDKTPEKTKAKKAPAVDLSDLAIRKEAKTKTNNCKSKCKACDCKSKTKSKTKLKSPNKTKAKKTKNTTKKSKK